MDVLCVLIGCGLSVRRKIVEVNFSTPLEVTVDILHMICQFGRSRERALAIYKYRITKMPFPTERAFLFVLLTQLHSTSISTSPSHQHIFFISTSVISTSAIQLHQLRSGRCFSFGIAEISLNTSAWIMSPTRMISPQLNWLMITE